MVRGNEIRKKYDLADYEEGGIPIPLLPDDGLVLLVGSSGSGKSTILREWFGAAGPVDASKCALECFDSDEAAERCLLAFGLRSIPTWFRPISTLSTGEMHRAKCAVVVHRGDGFIDEFTSTVDRFTARSLSVSVRKFHCSGRLVVASCHRDIIEWLQPDAIYDTDNREWLPRGCLRRPTIDIEIRAASIEDWVLFQDHHYLTRNIHRASDCYAGFWGDEPVAFVAVMHRTSGQIPLYYGESRLVVRPQFQGMGIGVAVSEAVAEEYTNRGLRYFSKTAHPALGNHRDKSLKWRPTSTNHRARSSYIKSDGAPRTSKSHGKSAASLAKDAGRVCFSHEFIGTKMDMKQDTYNGGA